MNFLRIILFPFVPVYAAAVALRNLFFDKNVFKAKSVTAKIISVGNITVGGSGKTPLVIYLLNLLKKENRKPGVLSRGYGRSSSGYIFVSDGKKILTTVEECGDEIYHTVLECKVPAAVSESRVHGAERLLKDAGIDVLVLDDAFQHRWIKRNVDLVICEQRFLIEDSFINHSLLPAGNLREGFSALKRADAVLINRKFSEPAPIPVKLEKYFKNKKVFTACYHSIGFVDVVKKNEYTIEEFIGQKSLVVSGIANPFSFLNALRQTKVDTENRMIFRDHKNYTLKEIQNIRKKFYATNSHSVVTTEKDAVKLMQFSRELDDIDVFYLKIELKMDDTESFKNFIINNLN
ncbi:MAG: tetraacyldisaccharide 4'-kinase [Ignavibacteriaceae bacterium]